MVENKAGADYKVIQMEHYEDTYSGAEKTKDDVIKEFEVEVISYIEKGYIPCGEMKIDTKTIRYDNPHVIKYYTTYSQAVCRPLTK
jgi:hypothetical protein